MFNFDWFGKKSPSTPKTLVLMYHRVADLPADLWDLAVSPPNFERQMRYLKENYEVISLSEMLENLAAKAVVPNAVCITFDDGYEDNYSAAKPILESFRCPAAFFIATEFIERRLPFWWDELENIVLKSESLPPKLAVEIGGAPFEFDLSAPRRERSARPNRRRSFWSSVRKTVSERDDLFAALYERLIGLPFNELQAALGELKKWANYDDGIETGFPMTTAQLKEIAAQPLFEIGLHTATHTALSLQSEEAQSDEIARGERWLRQHCGKVTRVLAYPNGRFDETTVAVAARQNLAAALTTMESPVTNASARYRLGRFQVKNWNEREFAGQIARWFKKNEE